MRKISAIVLLFLMLKMLHAQTFYGTGGNIPDDGNSIDFTLQVQNLQPPFINTTNRGLESVCVNITHTWDADLDISLIAPDGTQVQLTAGLGGDGDNYSVTCFNSNATTSIISGNAPFNGTFRPIGSLGMINNGQNGNGTWTLHILDTYAFADNGSLINWNITFGNNPSGVFLPDSSDIPIVIINSNGQHIPDEPKITAHMGIIDNGPGQINHLSDSCNGYDGYIGIEMRGSSSQSFPKKPYALETRDSSGNNLNVALLGMPAENDWCLIPNYSDKTLMRNSFTYDMARNMGRWAPRSRFCEVFINGEYQGVYVLMEKIKKDNNRVNISTLLPSEITGDDLTGGYIIKIDKGTGAGNDGWESGFLPPVNNNGQRIYFQYHYPEPDLINVQQKNYIQAFIDTFETVLNGPQFNNPLTGYYKFADLNSFVDYFILNEISKNVDGYRLSTFLYKDRNSQGGKVVMGPVWDFDLAYRNADYCSGDDFTGWAYQFGNICSGDGWQLPFWWNKMLTDSVFTNTLKCRWLNLRADLLDTIHIFNYIDSIYAFINQAQVRNFYQWPILGTYVWPNPQPIPTTYDGEIQSLKKWFRNRLNWLDSNMPGTCYNVAAESILHKNALDFYPNPASEKISITNRSGTRLLKLYITDASGRVVMLSDCNNNIDVQDIYTGNLKAGFYTLTLCTDKRAYNKPLLIIR